MTAAHRRPLEVVPTPTALTVLDDPTADAAPDDWRAESVIAQYAPEHQLIGCLMHLDIEHARALLDLVPDHAIWAPQQRWAYELIRRAVDAGDAPTPPTVVALGRRHAGALDQTSQPPSAHAHHRLALYIFDAYTQAIAPTVAASTYAREVLDAACRRDIATLGSRMHQLAAAELDHDDLTAHLSAIETDLASLRQRLHAIH